MNNKTFTNPFYIFILSLPFGISTGFVTITLPFILTKSGFSVATTSLIVSAGISANIWRFLWGPIADLTLSLKKWYCIGIIATVVTLIYLCYVPFGTIRPGVLTMIVFISQVAATLVMLPLGGIMAHRIEESKKGRAAGWYQAGNLGGVGLGGGAGIWLASNYGVSITGIILSGIIIFCAFSISLIADVKSNNEKKIIEEISLMGKDLLGLFKVPIVLFIMFLICSPIGSGATGNVWSSIANDWKVNTNTIALVTGILNGLVSALGCVIGGWVTDKFGVWKAYLSFGVICALAAIGMAAFPYNPTTFIVGVLFYSFSTGMVYAGFSAVLLYGIGKKSASTKYSLLSSLGNVPVVYMTALAGWAHDFGGSKYMLLFEAALGLFFVCICFLILKWLKKRNWLTRPVDAIV